jgi:hypothetical protein
VRVRQPCRRQLETARIGGRIFTVLGKISAEPAIAMKRDSIINISVFCLLVALGVATRWMSDAFKPTLSNFTATAAVAYFAGYFFRNKLAAVITPLAVIAISNFCLQRFDTIGQFAVVYVALLVPVLFGTLLRRKYNVATVIGGSLASSICFFLLTNFAEWPFNNLYPHTLDGLVQSYVAAIPFFRNTLFGDLFFTAATFGTYWAVSRSDDVVVPSRKPVEVVIKS